MTGRVLVVIFLQFLAPSSGLAKNMFFSAAYQQIRAGRYCFQVTYADIRAAGYRCPKPSIHTSSVEALEQLVFSEAGVRQAQTDLCLSQSFDVLKQNPELGDEWAADLIRGWLGLKKAQILRNRCSAFLDSFVPRGERNQAGFEKYRTKNPLRSLQGFFATGDNLKWQSTCLNWNRHQALTQAEGIYTATLPLLGSLGMLELIESNRSLIVDSRTRRPVTDAAILELDLNSPEKSLSIDVSRFRPALRSLAENVSTERAALAREVTTSVAKLADESTPNAIAMPTNVRNYLAETGALKRVMIDREMMDEDPFTGRVTRTTAAASCLASWYEETTTNSTIDFAGTFLVGAGAARLLKAREALASVSRLKSIVAAGQVGLDVASIPLMAPALRRCFSARNSTANGARTAAPPGDEDIELRQRVGSLPPSFNFQRFSIALTREQAPACYSSVPNTDSETTPNLLSRQVSRGNCLREVMGELLP